MSVELQGFLAWIRDNHPEYSDIALRYIEEYFVDALGGTATLRVDLESFLRAVPTSQRETVQDLWDEYCREYPFTQA